jgi:hypothetical protein
VAARVATAKAIHRPADVRRTAAMVRA